MSAKTPNLFKRSLGFVFITLVLTYSTFWFIERWLFENILEKILGNMEKYGVQVSYREMKASGFPDDLTFKLHEIQIKSGDFRFYAPALIIKAGLFFPLKHQFWIRVEDMPRITFQNYKGKGSYFRGSVLLERFRFKGIIFDLESLFFVKDNTPVLKILGTHLDFHLSRSRKEALFLEASAAGKLEGWIKKMRLQGNTRVGFETAFKITHIDSFVKEKSALETWRNHQGKVQFDKISLVFPQMDFVCDGSLSLDETLALKGDFKLKMQGFQRLFNILADQGVSERDLTFLKLSHVFLDREQDGTMSIPFSLKNKRFYLMGFPLPFTL
ncbi:MAG: DUF2125 domain-containing protein [Alphaproteobacteria bacterium]